ncbi:MAG: hypothetical protein QM775_00350 [Pirellulales bacterium]
MFKFEIDTSGVDKMLKKLQQNAARLDGTREVKLVDMATPSFMRAHSRFQSVEDWFTQSGMTADAFKQMTDAEKDEFTRTTTSFRSWQELINAAGVEYTKKQLLG